MLSQRAHRKMSAMNSAQAAAMEFPRRKRLSHAPWSPQAVARLTVKNSNAAGEQAARRAADAGARHAGRRARPQIARDDFTGRDEEALSPIRAPIASVFRSRRTPKLWCVF